MPGVSGATLGWRSSRIKNHRRQPPLTGKTAARYKAKVTTSDGPRTCFEARKKRQGKPDLVAPLGEIPFKRDRRAFIRDPATVQVPALRKGGARPTARVRRWHQRRLGWYAASPATWPPSTR